MDCKLILAAVYAAAAVISMAVTACSAIETKKILGQIEKELFKDADDGNCVYIPDICPFDLSPYPDDTRKCGCKRCSERRQ